MLGQGEATSTWFPADKIPSLIIEEYEKDIYPAVEELITVHSGQSMHTLNAVCTSANSTQNVFLEGNNG